MKWLVMRPWALLGVLVLPLVIGPGCAPQRATKGSNVSQGDSPVLSRLTQGVERRTLSNGLTVLVKEDSSAPVVAIVTWVKAGYFHEPDEVAGISHVLEHMFFNGTPTRPGPEDISRETKSYGGSLNAGTIYDRTSYYVVLPSERWSEGLEIQSDAFLHPLLDGEVLEKEREAILQEVRRKLDSPTAFGREKMFELAFDRHRMRRWRMGEEEGLRAMDRDILLRYYEDHYRPQNTVLAVVGDVKADEVLRRVEELYGAQPRGELRKHGGPPEPAQEGFRYRRMSGDLTRNYLFLGFHIPGVLHEDNAALDVLSTILGSGRSSRLVQKAKEELGVVTGVSASSYRFEDVGIFEVNATCNGEDLDRATREIFSEIERVKMLGVTPEEIARARGILEASEALDEEEVLGQASSLAHYEALGDYSLADEEREALLAVDADDVQRVARRYLTLDNATLLEYCPPWIASGRDPEAMGAHLEGAILAAVPQMPAPVAPEPSPSYLPREELDTWAERFADAPTEGDARHRYELPSGGVLLVKENHTASTVSIGAWFRGGRLGEIPNNAGLTRMMQRLMVKQTNNRDAEQLAAEIEALGSSIQRISHDDYFGFTVEALARKFPYAFDVLFDVLANPRFTADQLEREREAHLSAIQGVEDQSATLAFQLLRHSLYGEHPYGQPELGSLNFVRFTEISRIEEHHGEVVRPECAVITVTGNVDPDAVHELVLAYTEGWHGSGAALPSTAEAFYSKERFETPGVLLDDRENEVRKDRSQTAMLVAFPTVAVGHPDVYPLAVLQSITGGLGGSFFEEIRTRRGLAYQVSTFDVGRVFGGYFGTFVACSPDSADTVRELTLDLMEGLAAEAPDAESLDRARNYLAGSYVVGLQTNRAQGGRLARLELLGEDLGEFEAYPDHIRAVTREDLARVARIYFQDKPHALGVVAGTAGSAANP